MKRKICVLLGLVILMVSADIRAEETLYSKAGDIELEPITITALRARRRVTEVPSSTSIISEKDIQNSNAKNISDLLSGLEGVYTYDASGVGSVGVVNMRGFYGGMSSYQLVLIDGIPQNKGKDKLVDWDMISLDNIESVEVARGPASALYGDNAMSGVINIITKKPAKKPETKVYVSYGNFNTQEYKTSVSGAYKKLGVILGASQKITDGFREHCNYDRNHIDGKFNYNINDSQKAQFLLDYYKKKRGALPWALSEAQISQDRRQARPGTENDKSDETKTDTSITHAWDINAGIKTEETFYYKYDNADTFYTGPNLTQNSQKEQLENENVYGILLKSELNREIMGLSHEFTAGLDLERDDFNYKEYAAPYQKRGAMTSDYKVKKDKIGPYLQDEIKLISALRLIGGIRYDRIGFDFDDRNAPVNSKIEKMSKVTPRFSLVYTYQRDSSVYANYAQAFRTPTIGQMFTYGASANPDLAAEEAVNYEMGLHHQFSEFLRANLSLYWMRLDNEIWYDYASSKYQNYGKTSHKGIETGMDFKINKLFSGFANYACTIAKNESGNYKGKYLTSIPVFKASSGIHLATDFGLSWDMIVTYIGSSYIDSANNNKLPSYAAANTKISYQYKIMKISAGIDNLFDKGYNSYGYVRGNTKYFNPAPGRTFTLGVEAKF